MNLISMGKKIHELTDGDFCDLHARIDLEHLENPFYSILHQEIDRRLR